MDYFPPINGDQLDPDRSYINANPGTGIEGSWPHAKAIEGPMREILKVIDEAGIARNGENFTQLYEAISALISEHTAPDATDAIKGIVELATGSEALGGVDNARAVTSAALASAKLLANNGYYKLPGGLIIQWVRGAVVSSIGTITWPIAFPNAAFAVTTAADQNASAYVEIEGFSDLTTAGVKLYMQSTSGVAVTGTVMAIAIGY